jgi:tetratricopeptide (TPR) repeat protein
MLKVSRKIIYILLLLLFIPLFCQAENEVEEALNRLDVSLSHKKEYDRMKRSRIENLHKLMQETSDANVKYAAMRNMFEEYKSYRYDSAFAYAHRCLDLAAQLGDEEFVLDSKCNIAFSLVSAGISLEANNILSSIDASKLSEDIRRNYYFVCYKLWQEEADRVHNDELYGIYIKKSNAYLDSLCALITPESHEYWRFKGSKMMRQSKYKEALQTFDKFLTFKEISAHERAMVHAEMAWAYIWLKDEERR